MSGTRRLVATKMPSQHMRFEAPRHGIIDIGSVCNASCALVVIGCPLCVHAGLVAKRLKAWGPSLQNAGPGFSIQLGELCVSKRAHDLRFRLQGWAFHGPCRQQVERTHSFGIAAYKNSAGAPGLVEKGFSTHNPSKTAALVRLVCLISSLFSIIPAICMLREQGSRPPAWPPSSRGSGLSEASQSRCRHLSEEGPSRLHAHGCRTCRARHSKTGPGTCKAQAARPEVSGYRATGLEAGSDRHQRRRGVGALCSLQATVLGAKALKTESKRASGLLLRLTAASLDRNHASASSDSRPSLPVRLSVLPV